MKKVLFFLCVFLVCSVCQALGEDAFPSGPGKEIVLKKCQSCHDLDLIAVQKGSRDKWAAILEEMVNNGLVIGEREMGVVLEYLSTHLGFEKKK